MTDSKIKSVAYIGIDAQYFSEDDPNLVKFGLKPEDITRGADAVIRTLREEGFDADKCFIDKGETAIEVITGILKNKHYDVIVIGAGIRNIPEHFLLFEKLVNVVIEYAPRSRLAFNTSVPDTLQAVKRWV